MKKVLAIGSCLVHDKNMSNANTATYDADGRTIHTPGTNCPNCHAFNVEGRCNCTKKEKNDTMAKLNAIKLDFDHKTTAKKLRLS